MPSRPRHIGPSGPRVHAGRGRALALGLVLPLALSLGGCGTGLVAEALDDLDVTGSIAPRAAPRPPLGEPGADGRAADAALGAALDPHREEAGAVSWRAPASGAGGAFTPAGEVYVADEELCRAFTATLVPAPSAAPASFAGAACRQGAGAWTVKRLGPG